MSVIPARLSSFFDLSNWFSVALVALIAWIAAALLFHLGRRLLMSKRVEHSALGMALRRSEGPLELLMPILALSLVAQAAPDTLRHIGFPRQLLAVALVGAATLAIGKAVTGLGDWVVMRHPFNVGDNLSARRVLTQTRVLVRTANTLIILLGISIALMTFPTARKFGVSLLASAGVAGLVVGLAAKSVLGNLLAGLQLAVTQPLRIDDVLIVQGEWGRVEEITGTYVVLRIWDERRLVIPLQWFIENPFQNWTRTTSSIIGTVFLSLDYSMPVDELRAELKRLIEKAPEWDQRVCALQVTDATEHTLQIRVLASSVDSGLNWDLRCKLREGLIRYVQQRYPQCLPKLRAEMPAAEVTLSGPGAYGHGIQERRNPSSVQAGN